MLRNSEAKNKNTSYALLLYIFYDKRIQRQLGNAVDVVLIAVIGQAAIGAWKCGNILLGASPVFSPVGVPSEGDG